MAHCNAEIFDARVMRTWFKNASCDSGSEDSDESRSCMRAHDSTWNECYVTKAEYCVLTRACKNGDDVWRRAGTFECEM